MTMLLEAVAKEEFVPTLGHAIGAMLLMLLVILILNWIWSK